MSCSLLVGDNSIIDGGDGIYFQFDIGLNDAPRFQLQRDERGFYHYELNEEGQNNCDDWETMAGQITHVTEWSGQRSIAATGYYRSGSVNGSSWTTVRLNDEVR